VAIFVGQTMLFFRG